MKKNAIKNINLYFVKQKDESAEFWNYYDSIEDAVFDNHEPVEVFHASLKSLGLYETSVKVVITKAKKKEKEA